MAAATPEIVHPVAAEHIADWARALGTTFLRDPHGEEGERYIAALQRIWEPDRVWGARVDGRWVATLRTFERSLTVPGGGIATREIRADAVTNAAVAATQRRQGLLVEMLRASLAQARTRGDAVSILIASEWPIYGRFGYAPATSAADAVLHVARAGATLDGEPGRVRQIEREAFAAVAPAVFAAARRGRPGQIDRDAEWWNRALGLDGHAPPPTLPFNWFVHDGDDGPDGLLSWSSDGEFSLGGIRASVTVGDLVSAGDTAYRNLWCYLTGIDLAGEVRVSNRAVDEPVRWLLRDGRALELRDQVDFTWLRILDVESALAARRYACGGELVIDVTDEALQPFTTGRYLLACDGDEVSCGRTDRAADLELTERALASIYLGGFRLGALAISGAARELRSGALARGDAMFSVPLAPWTATWF